MSRRKEKRAAVAAALLTRTKMHARRKRRVRLDHYARVFASMQRAVHESINREVFGSIQAGADSILSGFSEALQMLKGLQKKPVLKEIQMHHPDDLRAALGLEVVTSSSATFGRGVPVVACPYLPRDCAALVMSDGSYKLVRWGQEKGAAGV